MAQTNAATVQVGLGQIIGMHPAFGIDGLGDLIGWMPTDAVTSLGALGT